MGYIDDIRAARKVEVTVDKITLTGHRPTIEQFSELTSKGVTAAEVARMYVTGWSGVTEADILPGGNAKKQVPFSKELFAEVIGDMTKLWKPFTDAVVSKIRDDAAAQEENAKNSKAG